jgi:predicted nuclease of predicted toxin-antitoxin system
VAERHGRAAGLVITFLIDENLSPALIRVAIDCRFAAFHINHRGWSSLKDPQVFHRLLDEDLTLVTNNWDDFRPMLGRTEVHPGIVVILPNVRRERQVELFSAALEVIRDHTLDMVNTVLKVDADGTVTRYDWPE